MLTTTLGPRPLKPVALTQILGQAQYGVKLMLYCVQLELCKHYQLQASSRMGKREVEEILFQYYVDEGILDEGVSDDFNVGLTSDSLREIELAKIALETQKAKLDHELALKRVAAGTDVPPFYEDDVDKYFTMFEKVAISLLWSHDVDLSNTFMTELDSHEPEINVYKSITI